MRRSGPDTQPLQKCLHTLRVTLNEARHIPTSQVSDRNRPRRVLLPFSRVAYRKPTPCTVPFTRKWNVFFLERHRDLFRFVDDEHRIQFTNLFQFKLFSACQAGKIGGSFTEFEHMNSQTVIDHIVSWLVDYAQTRQSQGMGCRGIRRALTLRSLQRWRPEPGCRPFALEMPIHQPASQDARATKHISELERKFDNVHSIRTDLTTVF